MRVYQSEEAPGSPEAHAVFLEPGQVAEPPLSTEEPRPLELAGPTRGGLEGPERRRFSASELMTRLHSSLRLGRHSAARALAQGAGAGAAREGTCSSPWPSERPGSPMPGGARLPHWTREAGCWSAGVWRPAAQGHPPSALASSREGVWQGAAQRRDEGGRHGDGSPRGPQREPRRRARVQVAPLPPGSGLRPGRTRRSPDALSL